VTQKLYLIDSYMREFEASVLDLTEREGKRAVVLDRTCFYPEGGGQPCDLGRLNGAAVLNVVEEQENIYHFVDDDFAGSGEKIPGCIDWERRFDHMQQHSGQHILSQAFLRTLDSQTLSFRLGSEFSTIDLDVEALTTEAIYRAEDLANGIIYENRPVKCRNVDDESFDLSGIRGYSAGEDKKRVVEISDFDRSFCGGTHCLTTGEVGIVKVRRWERSRGKARVEFFCGRRALKDYRAKNRRLYEVSRELGVSDSEAPDRVRKQLEENKELRRDLNRATETLLDMEAASMISGAEKTGEVKVIARVFHGRDGKEIKLIAEKIAVAGNCVALLGSEGDSATLIFSCSTELELDMQELMACAAPIVGGKGGGSRRQAQGGGPLTERLQEAMDAAEERLAEQIARLA